MLLGSQNFGSTWVPLPGDGKRARLTWLMCRISSMYFKRYKNTCGDPPEKMNPSRPDLQGHSRSSKVTWIDRLPVTSDVSKDLGPKAKDLVSEAADPHQA